MTRGFVLRLASPGSQSTLETFDPPPCVVSLTFLDNVVRGLVVPPPFFYPTPPPCAGMPWVGLLPSAISIEQSGRIPAVEPGNRPEKSTECLNRAAMPPRRGHGDLSL